MWIECSERNGYNRIKCEQFGCNKGDVILKKYAIKNDYIGKDRVLSILNYDERKRVFTVDIPGDVSTKEVPYIMASFVKRGKRTVGNDWSMRWVRERIVPNTRQNIGQIMRENGMKRYDEHELLVKNQGRCCQDDYYIEELK